MKTFLTVFVLAMTLICVAACSDLQIARVQKGAVDVQAATTQPIVQAVAPIVPYGQVAVALVSAVAGAVAAFAPLFAKVKTAEAAAVEVAKDTALSRSDDPFSAQTKAILDKHGVDTPGTKA